MKFHRIAMCPPAVVPKTERTTGFPLDVLMGDSIAVHDGFVRLAFCQVVEDHRDHHARPLDARLAVTNLGVDADPLSPVHRGFLLVPVAPRLGRQTGTQRNSSNCAASPLFFVNRRFSDCPRLTAEVGWLGASAKRNVRSIGDSSPPMPGSNSSGSTHDQACQF